MRDGIVQLNGNLVGEVGEVSANGLAGSEFGRLVATNDVLECSGAHEVFLLQTELLALKEVIVGVQDTSNVLSKITVQHSLDVVTIVNCKNSFIIDFVNRKYIQYVRISIVSASKLIKSFPFFTYRISS